MYARMKLKSEKMKILLSAYDDAGWIESGFQNTKHVMELRMLMDILAKQGLSNK